jgi:hypothetical protein
MKASSTGKAGAGEATVGHEGAEFFDELRRHTAAFSHHNVIVNSPVHILMRNLSYPR